MKPKKGESQSQKTASQTSAHTASNEAILAAITTQGVELAKVSKLVDDLKKSMEGRLDSIEACLSTFQKEHHEAQLRMDDMNEALTTADNRITALEARSKLQVTHNNAVKVFNSPSDAERFPDFLIDKT
ncbi:unnamed protein product [Scomber scombrus]|uniref:Unnamed protein product n=1 Tax=Scomber scombrus TaxID=13677 RepID=A0AAV1N445_SCOSC